MLVALLVLVVIEASARIDDRIMYGAPLLENYDVWRIYQVDGLGMHGRPYASYLKWKMNSLGYRGPEPRSGTILIATIGASETFGLYESEDNEYPRQLERNINRRLGRDAVSVVNAAYPGMSLTTSMRLLPDMLERVRPVVVTIYPSPSSYISLDGFDRVHGRRPPARPELRLTRRVGERLKEVLPRPVQNWMRKWVIEREVRRMGILPMDRLPKPNVDRFRSDTERMVGMLMERGVTPVLVTHATRFGESASPEDYPMLVAWRKFFPEMKEDGFVVMERQLNDVMRDVARERGLLLVDAARIMPPGQTCFADFSHLTDDGAARLARILDDAIAPVLTEKLKY